MRNSIRWYGIYQFDPSINQSVHFTPKASLDMYLGKKIINKPKTLRVVRETTTPLEFELAVYEAEKLWNMYNFLPNNASTQLLGKPSRRKASSLGIDGEKGLGILV